MTEQIITSAHVEMAVCRGNQLDAAGWAAVADALERVTTLKSLNGCGQYAAILDGGMKKMTLEKEWELGVWATRYLERSASTLTVLDIRYHYLHEGDAHNCLCVIKKKSCPCFSS